MKFYSMGQPEMRLLTFRPSGGCKGKPFVEIEEDEGGWWGVSRSDMAALIHWGRNRRVLRLDYVD